MTFSLLVVLALSVASVPATAEEKEIEGASGGNNKVIVINVPPNTSVMEFVNDNKQVYPSDQPSGQLAARYDKAPGGVVETFVPVGHTTGVYLWDETNGYRLIGIVRPATTWPDTILNAASTTVVR
jgi:hypothetical protein